MNSHLLEVTELVVGPVDEADHAVRQLRCGGVVVLREGQQERQCPDHAHHHLGLRGGHTLLQRMDDGHVPARVHTVSYRNIPSLVFTSAATVLPEL